MGQQHVVTVKRIGRVLWYVEICSHWRQLLDTLQIHRVW